MNARVVLSFFVVMFAMTMAPSIVDGTEATPTFVQLPPSDDPPPGYPPPRGVHVSYVDIDHARQITEIDFSNGVVAQVDYRLDKVFIAHGSELYEFPLSQMYLAASHGDARMAASMRAQWESRTSKTLSNIASAVSKLRAAAQNPNLPIPNIAPVPDQGGAEDCTGFWSCFFVAWDFFENSYLYWEYGWPDAGPSDPNDWDDWHDGQCGAVTGNWRSLGLSGAGTGLACGAIPESTALCLVGLAQVMDDEYRLGRSMVNCNSSY